MLFTGKCVGQLDINMLSFICLLFIFLLMHSAAPFNKQIMIFVLI